MSRLTSIILLAGLTFAPFFGHAQQTVPKIKVEPMQPAPANSGQKMYMAYCASCHGPDGKGDGPAAPALKIPPPDLTLLSQRNGGQFPTDKIRTILKFGVATPAHGSIDMPVWGDLFTMMPDPPSPNSVMVVNQRIINLTAYLRQMQQK